MLNAMQRAFRVGAGPFADFNFRVFLERFQAKWTPVRVKKPVKSRI
jgi:hypothetical protein